MRRFPVVIVVPALVCVLLAIYPGWAEEMEGEAQARDAVSAVVAGLSAVPGEAGTGLLPEGTTVDRAELTGPILNIDLTLPPGASDWRLSPLDVQRCSQALAAPYSDRPAFGGVVVRLRSAVGDAYKLLGDLASEVVAPAPGAESDAPPDLAVSEVSHRTYDHARQSGARGPAAPAARQPAGALSGVVVFCAGGHGWTAGDTSWFLQRPVLLEMNEDYGNIEQLNYFVNYAYNAGATVVPFRPVGYQPIEIVLDNDDPGVTYTGSWSNGTASKYYENNVTSSGVRYEAASASSVETATARYTPVIPETGLYPVYCFTPPGSNRVPQTYRIQHAAGLTEVVVDHRDVGNGWVWLGEFFCEAGGVNYVEITNEAAISGAVIADAIRWGNGIGDIVRPGPGTLSGYPRNEECQRYWAQSELGNNAVGFSASSIWDASSSDQSDNISTGSRWAREMNQVPAGGVLVDRWKRVYLEFHSNAFSGGARGSIALISASAPTTYQEEYATFMSDEVDGDMLILDSDFEHEWYDRLSATYTAEFGAISTTGNSNEFDATIIEVAFHDNQQDAELLRDARVRAALARSSVQGVIRFLNSLPGSQVPLAFAPDLPRDVRVEDAGNGDVVVSWSAPLSGEAHGDPATGYVLYESANGYAFSVAAELGDVLTTTISGVPVGQTRYFRVAATNTGGESTPSETLAVRRPAEGTANVLIVNGFDRLRRFQNPRQDVGGEIERPMWRRVNSFDYAVQFAQALESTSVGFASCVNDAVNGSLVMLGDYDIALWILGTESTEDSTLSSGEQLKLDAFLEDGGALFVSGAEIGFDLIDDGGGVSFMQNVLRCGFAEDDAGTFDVTAAAGGILHDVGSFDFDPDNGAPYVVYTPDVLTARTDAVAVLDYVGGTGGVAGVQYDPGVYRAVTFGFPFEAITSASARADIMQRVIAFLEATPGPLPYDADADGDVDLNDYLTFLFCYQGPAVSYPDGHFCLDFDGDEDNDVDVADFALLQDVFTGEL